jgi:hypothetical protein
MWSSTGERRRNCDSREGAVAEVRLYALMASTSVLK